MASGILMPAQEATRDGPRAAPPEPMAVEVVRSTARSVRRTLTIDGDVEPDMATPVRAQADGVVDEVVVERGQWVEEGDTVARIAPAERQARLAQARAELRRAEREFEAVERLAARGFATEKRLEEVSAALAAAEAAVAAAQERLEDLVVRAPAAGVVNALTVDPGEVVQVGAEVARLVDTDPLMVDVRVPQQNIAAVETGMTARVDFATGETREGVVDFVSANAEPQTRTFEVEIRVPNPGREVPAGISAEVSLPLGEDVAHFVSPAILSLGPDGRLGVKTVDAEDRVVFHPVELVRAETDGIWVSGLPQTADVITVGQGFVSAGERVRATRVEPAADGPTDRSLGPAAGGGGPAFGTGAGAVLGIDGAGPGAGASVEAGTAAGRSGERAASDGVTAEAAPGGRPGPAGSDGAGGVASGRNGTAR
jgi:RND family efflux transporter MFP subunit